MSSIWRKCTSCKKDIALGQKYFICSVSTCSGRVTNYAFCSVDCWEAHVPVERHREGSAGALERTAPTSHEAAAEAPKRVVVASGTASPKAAGQANEDEILVVASKVKKYIVDRSGMNTSAGTFEALSKRIRTLCDTAIENARRKGRKTVMDSDVP